MDHKQEAPPAPGALVRGDFYCPHCEAEFDSQDQLEVHSRSAHGAAVDDHLPAEHRPCQQIHSATSRACSPPFELPNLYRAATLNCDNSGRLLPRRGSRSASRERGGQARGSGNNPTRSGRARVAPVGELEEARIARRTGVADDLLELVARAH